MRNSLMKLIAAMLAATFLLPGAGQFSNRRAPGFSLADSQFHQHDTQDYRGKVLLVDIMLTTCPTCNALADTLVQVQKKYGDKLGILSIVTLPDHFDDAENFSRRHGITWPIVFDSGQVIASYMEVTPSNPSVHFPHLFVIDGSGMIRDDYGPSEDAPLTVDTLSAAIDRLLSAK
jgi:peroxiredoxin